MHSNLVQKIPCYSLRLILPDRGIWSVVLGHAPCISILPYRSSTLQKKCSQASQYSIYLLDLVSLFILFDCLSVCLSIFLPNWIITFGDIYGIFLEHSIYIYLNAWEYPDLQKRGWFCFFFFYIDGMQYHVNFSWFKRTSFSQL